MKEFVMPSVNLFGADSVQELGTLARRLGKNKALLITDTNLVKCGICGKVEEILQKENIKYMLFHQVNPNPTKDNVYAALEAYRANRCEFIIGLGGGSPNDCAKATSILTTNPGVLEDFVGGNRSQNPGAPIIAINTTAGTASEISRAYIISDEEKQEKLIAKDIHALPYASINDPMLMLGLPTHITAQTGMDALAHAVESYVCNIANNMTKEIAIGACRLVFDNLREVIAEPQSVTLRENMTFAQSMGGMAFCNSGVGIGHAIAHALGATYHLSHGLCTGLVLPAVMRFNARAEGGEYAKLAQRLFPLECMDKDEKQCVDIIIAQVEKLSQDVGTALPLSQLGVTEDAVDSLADKALRDGNTGRNPITPTLDEMKLLLRTLL